MAKNKERDKWIQTVAKLQKTLNKEFWNFLHHPSQEINPTSPLQYKYQPIIEAKQGNIKKNNFGIS